MRASLAKIGLPIRHKNTRKSLGKITEIYKWGVRFQDGDYVGIASWGEIDRVKD